MNIISYNIYAIYFILNLCFNNNIKFIFKLYSNFFQIVLYLYYYLIFIY